MKTISDLNALIPTIVERVVDNLEIGECSFGSCEEDYSETPVSNSVYYEEDGWSVNVVCDCCGVWDYDPGDYWTPPTKTLLKAWGKVVEISASHNDIDTDIENTFNSTDVKELWDAIDKKLESI